MTIHRTQLAAGAGLAALASAARPRGVLAVRANVDPNKILVELDAAVKGFVERSDRHIATLEASLDDLSTRFAALHLNGSGAAGLPGPGARRAIGALGQFAKSGDASVLAALRPQAAATVGNDPSGGYLVPDEISDFIVSLQRRTSAMRKLARVVTTRSHSYKVPINKNGTASGWVGETSARPETTALDFGMMEFPAGEIYANPAVTQQLLDDNDFDLGNFLAEQISLQFDEQEGAAFVSGDGLLRPRGFLDWDTYTGAGNAAFGKIQTIHTGSATTLGTSTTASDKLIDVLQSMKAQHRANSTWLMNSTTQGEVSKLKDGQGNYLWQRALVAGSPDMLLGRPVELDENMPDIGASAFPIALGDWQNGYLINDRMDVRLLRDPYTNKPYVMFYATKRVGGGVLNAEAIKLLQVAT